MLVHLVVVWPKTHITIMVVATLVNSRKCQHFSHSEKFRFQISSSTKFIKNDRHSESKLSQRSIL